MRCTVFLGASIDGFIARRDGALDWLPGAEAAGADEASAETHPQPDVEGDPEVEVDAEVGDDGGYGELMASVDALLMGRASFETVVGFGIGWPYELPVVVLTHRSLDPPPDADVRTEQGPITEVLARLEAQGMQHVYVDGGDVVQQALAADVVDRVVIGTVPVLLGDGLRWHGALPEDRWFTVESTRMIPHGMTQTTWVRDRSR